MSVFRIEHNNFERDYNALHPDTFNEAEWRLGHDTRAEESSWIERYKYEASLIATVIKEKNAKTVLEIGAGSGKLSSFIHPLVSYELDYHLIDRPTAKETFEHNKGKGTFFAKDLSLDLNISDLDKSYDLVICNDVLEHLLAPANILRRIHALMHKDSVFFVSVPNWRMAHQFIYRGLWEYDNFIYFMHIHGFRIDDVYPSILQTPSYPRLQSEETMPEELLRSWNYYFICSLREGMK